MLPRSLMMLPRSEAEAHHSRPRADGSLASAFALHAPPPYADPQDAYDADDNEEGEKEDGEVSAYFLRRPVSRRAASASSRCTSTPSSGLLTPDPSCPAMSPEIYGFAPVQTDGDESDLFPSFANLSLSSSSHRSSPSPTTPITPHTTRRPRPRSAASPITPQRQPRSQAPSPWYESPLRHESCHRCVTPPRAHPSPPTPTTKPLPGCGTHVRAGAQLLSHSLWLASAPPLSLPLHPLPHLCLCLRRLLLSILSLFTAARRRRAAPRACHAGPSSAAC
jgi:hypothetical protein